MNEKVFQADTGPRPHCELQSWCPGERLAWSINVKMRANKLMVAVIFYSYFRMFLMFFHGKFVGNVVVCVGSANRMACSDLCSHRCGMHPPSIGSHRCGMHPPKWLAKPSDLHHPNGMGSSNLLPTMPMPLTPISAVTVTTGAVCLILSGKKSSER